MIGIGHGQIRISENEMNPPLSVTFPGLTSRQVVGDLWGKMSDSDKKHQIEKIHLSIPRGLLNQIDVALEETRRVEWRPTLSRSQWICRVLGRHLEGEKSGPSEWPQKVAPVSGPDFSPTRARASNASFTALPASSKQETPVTLIRRAKQASKAKGVDLADGGEAVKKKLDPQIWEKFRTMLVPDDDPDELASLLALIENYIADLDRVHCAMDKTVCNATQNPMGLFRALLQEKLDPWEVKSWKQKRENPAMPNRQESKGPRQADFIAANEAYQPIKEQMEREEREKFKAYRNACAAAWKKLSEEEREEIKGEADQDRGVQISPEGKLREIARQGALMRIVAERFGIERR
jgi:hypothetical protein